MKAWWPVRAFLIALGVPAMVLAATPGLVGLYRCSVTDYMWPSAPDDSPTVTGNGSIEFESHRERQIPVGCYVRTCGG